MATSGSFNFTRTRDQILYRALRIIGRVALGQPPSAEWLANASEAANLLLKHWQNKSVFLHTRKESTLAMTAGSAGYDLPLDTIAVEDVRWYEEASEEVMKAITRSDYATIDNKFETGTPYEYYFEENIGLAGKASLLWVYNLPTYTSAVVAGTDAETYVCSHSHTSSASTVPITGADYLDYWIGDDTGFLTPAVHALATAYYSGIIRYTRIRLLEDFDAAADNADLPVRALDALVWGIADELSAEANLPIARCQQIAAKAHQLFMEYRGSNKEWETDHFVRPYV